MNYVATVFACGRRCNLSEPIGRSTPFTTDFTGSPLKTFGAIRLG
jgi:hypothetical protein